MCVGNVCPPHRGLRWTLKEDSVSREDSSFGSDPMIPKASRMSEYYLNCGVNENVVKSWPIWGCWGRKMLSSSNEFMGTN